MQFSADAVERAALALYIARKGDPETYPWPPKSAPKLRREVRAILTALDAAPEPVPPPWVAEFIAI